jgi:hypothetical protein
VRSPAAWRRRSAFRLPVEAAILPALPMVLVQALLLDRSYATQYRAALAT